MKARYLTILVAGLVAGGNLCAVNSTHKAKSFYEMMNGDAALKGQAATFLSLIALPAVGYDKKVQTEVTDDKPVVLFIPTEAAFAAWAQRKDFEDKAKNEQPTQLKQVLKYHVFLLGGNKDFMNMKSLLQKGKLEMASGDELTVSSETSLTDKSGKSAKIVGDPYEFKHGFVYFVDKVLIPTA